MFVNSIEVPFFQFFQQKSQKLINKTIFPIYLFSPGMGLWHWRRGWGWGGGPFRIKNPKQSQTILRTKFAHTSGTFFQQMVKHTFKISPYIQKTTTNPTNALKITFYNTKHTINQLIKEKQEIETNTNKQRKVQTFQRLILLYIQFP